MFQYREQFASGPIQSTPGLFTAWNILRFATSGSPCSPRTLIGQTPSASLRRALWYIISPLPPFRPYFTFCLKS